MGLKYDTNTKKAKFIGTVPLDVIDESSSNWGKFLVEDIIVNNYITEPDNYICTLGSGTNSEMVSLATTPAYPLPTNSQYYLAGRDVFRWGGEKDPHEIDFDRYGLTPDFNRGISVLWKAPKTEPHHLSKINDQERLEMLDSMSDLDSQFCKSLLIGELP